MGENLEESESVDLFSARSRYRIVFVVIYCFLVACCRWSRSAEWYLEQRKGVLVVIPCILAPLQASAWATSRSSLSAR